VAKGDDIEERLIDFAVRVIRVGEALPDSQAGRHIKGSYYAAIHHLHPTTVKQEAQKAARISFTSSRLS
jgi:hypothetical protein